MGGLIQYPHVFYYWKRYERRLYPPSAYGLGGLDMRTDGDLLPSYKLHVTSYKLPAAARSRVGQSVRRETSISRRNLCEAYRMQV